MEKKHPKMFNSFLFIKIAIDYIINYILFLEYYNFDLKNDSLIRKEQFIM